LQDNQIQCVHEDHSDKIQNTLAMNGSASFLATLDWDILNEPIHERYTNLLNCVDPETNFDVHGEMGFVTHINTSDTPTLHEILNMTDTVEQEQWFEAMDSEILALLGKQTL
jgi:hypothetical protein